MAGTNNSWNNQIAGSYNQIILNSGSNGVAIGTDNATGAITIGTGTSNRLINIGRSVANHTITFGNTNGTTSVDIASGTGNMILNSAGTNTITGTLGVTIQSQNTAMGITSGTGVLSISADAAATTVNLATGGAVKTVTLGSTNTSSSLALKYGTSDFTLASATGTVMSALDTGEITYPLQSAFAAYLSATATDVTGDNTNYTVICDTEVFDQNADYNNSTGVFTAPVTGKYHFIANLTLATIGASTTCSFFLNVTARSTLSRYNPSTIADVTFGQATMLVGWFVNMTAGDTASMSAQARNTTKTVDVQGDGSFAQTSFMGYLVC